MDIGSDQDARADASDFSSLYFDLRLLGILRIGINDGQEGAFPVDRTRARKSRKSVQASREKLGSHCGCPLMRGIHFEDMEDGCNRELVFAREKRRMDIVDELGGGGHYHFVRVTIEDIQSDA